MKIEMILCESTILSEIENKKSTKKLIAMSYAFCLKSSEKIDYAKINKAIIKRWSMSALHDIKNWAWSGKCFKD